MNFIDWIILLFAAIGLTALAGMFAAGFVGSVPMFFACIGVTVTCALVNKLLERWGRLMKP